MPEPYATLRPMLLDVVAPSDLRANLRILLLFLPIGLLIALIQKETARPEVLDMYMNVTGEEVFAARLLPRMIILLLNAGSMHLITFKYGNYLVQFLSAWGALWFIFLFARSYLQPMSALAATLLAAMVPFFGFLMAWGYSYFYDLPIFFFSALGLWAITTKRFVVLVIVVLFGTLTKETISWVIAAFFLFQARRWPPRRGDLLRTSLLVAIFVLAYIVSRAIIRDPGSDVVRITALPTQGEPRFLTNLRELLFLRYRGGVQNVYFGLLIHITALVSYFRLPSGLRRLYLATPFFVLPHFIFSNIWELRLFNELIPLGAVGTMYVLELHWEKHGRPPAIALAGQS